MLVGDASKRAQGTTSLKSQTCFRCYSAKNFGGDNAAPCQDATCVPITHPNLTKANNHSLDTEAFPSKPCLGGIRSNILYPTCWDGKNLDSPDHQSHVANPTAGPWAFSGTSTGGACPSTHPVKIPQLMLEIVWDTTGFNDKNDWPTDGKSLSQISLT